MKAKPPIGLETQFLAHPLHTLFFCTIALNTYALVAFVLIGLAVPGAVERFAAPGLEEVKIMWRLQVLVQIVCFIHVSLWAERIGTGPFAGRMRTSVSWILFAILASPVVSLLIQRLVYYTLLSGDPDGVYTSETAQLMTSYEAIGPMMLFGILIAAPLVEETIYRGVGIGYLLARGIPDFVAILMTAIAFTVIHSQYSPSAMVTVFLSGLFLGWLRVRSGSMMPSIAAHMVINLQAVLILLESGSAAASSAS